jgi:tRNA (guanine37-N1)-methyltransferase
MIIDIVTIFPEFFDHFLKTSIIKRAIEQNLIQINIHQLRDYSHNKHKKVDDTPYGGGAGMLMQFPPFSDVIHHLKKADSKVILLSPQGAIYNQQKAIHLSKFNHLILLCGHYEGIDYRVEQLIDYEISIGDYILTGGEIPAMILADSIARLVDGVIHIDSKDSDSLQNGLLKYPQYTKPLTYKGLKVPDVLLSGNHQEIDKWRKTEQIKNTYLKRPDLLEKLVLSTEDQKILKEIIKNK